MNPRVSRLAARLALCVGALASASARQKISLYSARYSVLSFGLLREPIQRGLLAAALRRQLPARRRRGSPAPAQLCLQTMRSSVACRGHEMAENKKNMTPE